MNKEATKTYQELLLEFSKAPKDDPKAFTEKYEEMLNIFLNLGDVYTIAAKASTPEAVKNNKAKAFCALNHKNLPSIWLFTEREFAVNFVRHFGLIKDGVEYLIAVSKDEMIDIVKQAVFNGVYQFIIDEGKTSISVVPYDLYNVYLKSIGEEEFLPRSKYMLMVLFNSMKFNGKKVYAIESDDNLENGTSSLAVDRNGVLNIFDKKEDADVHKYDIGYGRKEASELNLIDLRNAVNVAVENKVEVIKFELDEKIIEVEASKIQYILNEMVKIMR